MDDDLLDAVDRYFAKLDDQPFGNTERVSGRTLQPFSMAGQRAASNLLTKAIRALDAGDLDRAHRLVDRAARLPYDQHEETCQALSGAHMLLFFLVTDALEESERGDARWLDAAIAVVAQAEESGSCVMRDVLVAVDNDYKLSRSERTALRRAIADVPERPELRDLRLEPDEMSEVIMPVLAACRAYRDML